VLQVFGEGVQGDGGGTDGTGDGDAEQIDVDDDLRWSAREFTIVRVAKERVETRCRWKIRR
jgi:hypothetical protein